MVYTCAWAIYIRIFNTGRGLTIICLRIVLLDENMAMIRPGLAVPNVFYFTASVLAFVFLSTGGVVLKFPPR